MLKWSVVVVLAASPMVALADRYGVDEAMREGSGGPTSSVGLLLVLLLLVGFLLVVEMGATRRSMKELTARYALACEEIHDARDHLETEAAVANLHRARHAALLDVVQRYVDGEQTDEEFAAEFDAHVKSFIAPATRDSSGAPTPVPSSRRNPE